MKHRETQLCLHEVNITRITHYSLHIVVWMEKHAVDKISVIVDMREFEVMGSGSLTIIGFSSSR